MVWHLNHCSCLELNKTYVGDLHNILNSFTVLLVTLKYIMRCVCGPQCKLPKQKRNGKSRNVNSSKHSKLSHQAPGKCGDILSYQGHQVALFPKKTDTSGDDIDFSVFKRPFVYFCAVYVFTCAWECGGQRTSQSELNLDHQAEQQVSASSQPPPRPWEFLYIHSTDPKWTLSME